MSPRRLLTPFALLALVAACGSTPVSPPAATATPLASAAPSPTPASASASPAASTSEPASSSPAQPGTIAFTPCPPVPSSTACLAGGGGDVHVMVPSGANVTLLLELHNPGSAASAPVALLLHAVDGDASLPLGQPACTTCSSTVSPKLIGLEWPALAPGESRAMSVGIPVTGSGGRFEADLYARPLADVMADEIANGITPGQQTWTIDLGIRS